MEPDDCIIDGGNEWYENTERRIQEVSNKGLLYLGMGIFDGEEGARYGPSLMPNGSHQAYSNIKDILEKVAAQVKDGPCVTYIGDGGSCNFVKMVHNGIEDGDMQVKDQLGDGYLVDTILDKTGMKETEKGTVQQATELSVAALTILTSLDCRYLSGLKKERENAAGVLKEAGLKEEITNLAQRIDKKRLIDDVRQALYASKICSYAQWMNLLRTKSVEKGWNFNFGELARIWKAWRRVVGLVISAGISTPGMCASLAYFDTYRRARLPTNLVQAQRDLFGPHTYERIDCPRSFHMEWTKLARKSNAGVGALN
ncbi:hypothetical protein CRYUN_Cryun19dG0117300 [Craigia yunnanensis]